MGHERAATATKIPPNNGHPCQTQPCPITGTIRASSRGGTSSHEAPQTSADRRPRLHRRLSASPQCLRSVSAVSPQCLLQPRRDRRRQKTGLAVSAQRAADKSRRTIAAAYQRQREEGRRRRGTGRAEQTAPGGSAGTHRDGAAPATFEITTSGPAHTQQRHRAVRAAAAPPPRVRGSQGHRPIRPGAEKALRDCSAPDQTQRGYISAMQRILHITLLVWTLGCIIYVSAALSAS